MIFDNIKHVDIRASKNIFNTKTLCVTVKYNSTLCMETFAVIDSIRIFSKTEGTPWVEVLNGNYITVGIGDSMYLSEYCSYKGILVPQN